MERGGAVVGEREIKEGGGARETKGFGGENENVHRRRMRWDYSWVRTS
jgi:hypothetical protein